MIESNIYQLIKNLAEREKIKEEEVIDVLSLAIQDVYQKNFAAGELKVIFDPGKKQFIAYQVNQVVKQAEDDPIEEVSVEKGQLPFQPLNLKEIINYEEILQHFRLSLQRKRQKKWTEELMPFQGKIIEGIIQEAYHNYCLVDLLNGKGLGYWGKSEWLSRNIPPLGKSQRFLVKEIKAEGEYPVILACRSEEFLRKLLAIEIPEIAQGKIIIQNILRYPGVISKVIVRSEVPISNLLGACIGEKGIRIQNIEKEMSPERIDLVEWKEDKKEQLIKLFSPAEVLGFCKLQKKDDVVVIVRPEQLSLSLALKGKIIQLIESYLKVKIQVLTWEEIDKRSAVVIEVVKELKNSYPKLNYKLYGPE